MKDILKQSQTECTDDSPLIVTKPPHRTLVEIINSSLVVGQEVALAVILLAVHREIVAQEETPDADARRRMPNSTMDYFHDQSTKALVVVYATLLIIVYYNQQSSVVDANIKRDCKTNNQSAEQPRGGQRRKKAIVRLSDGVLLAVMLRLISGVLRTLTASYSTDTVYALAISGMAIHLLACDYRYANGIHIDEEGKMSSSVFERSSARPRPAFLGGTVSLNAAFFSTALLVSRIQSNATSYAFVSSVVTLFAFYPASRHQIARRYPNTVCEFGITLTVAMLC